VQNVDSLDKATKPLHENVCTVFKNKESIFSSSLRKGFYIFAVSLMPRYNGIYHLNPARAELMYFPTFFGREGMKEVSVN
jgi:hypothetical protein